MPKGRLLESFLDDRRAAGRMACPPDVIPAPGQYLLAHDPASDSPLAVPVFSAGESPGGFLAAPPLPTGWFPGLALSLRGPLGRGFHLPASARRAVLAALDASPAPLLSLLAPALAQGASVSFVCDSPPVGLPAEVEIHPLAALAEVCAWADFLALVLPRESLSALRERLHGGSRTAVPRAAQALIVMPMPCGGLADCGVCCVNCKEGEKLACKNGPVFDLYELL